MKDFRANAIRDSRVDSRTDFRTEEHENHLSMRDRRKWNFDQGLRTVLEVESEGRGEVPRSSNGPGSPGGN